MDHNLIDRLTPEVVMSWVPAALVPEARALLERGRVAKPAIRRSYVEAVVADVGRRRVRARIQWGAAGPTSTCQCGARFTCKHAAAIGLLLIGECGEEKGSGEHAGAGQPVSLSPADRELIVRRERGASELFQITPQRGARFYGSFSVHSPSSRSYEVTVRSLDELHNSCSCPDFATNLLGTCKHIEAVLHRVRRILRRRGGRADIGRPATSYLYLVWGSEPEVRLRVSPLASPAVRRFAATYFRTDERPALARPLAEVWPLLVRDAGEAELEIPKHVARFIERARDLSERQRAMRVAEAEVRAAGREQPAVRVSLYPYQVEGVAFLASRRRALLADEMGLGKTVQAIAAMVNLMRKGDARRSLIVCPASLKRQWEREILRFTALDEGQVGVVTGPLAARRKLYADPPQVLITSYELARADERDIAVLSPDLLILDEAQRIKNWRTRTADAIKRIPSQCAFVLTGTPLENRLDDLYSLMQVVDPHVFGPLWRYNQDFSELDERGKVIGYRNLDELRRRVANVMLRRRKKDVLAELPAQIINRLSVPMTPRQAAIHEEAEQGVAMLLAKLKKRPLTPAEERRLLSAFQRMRMSCDAAGLVDKETVGAPKLTELAGILEELCVQGGHKVVVFSEWERMQAMAASACEEAGVGYVRLHGGVPSDGRGRLIQRFFEDPSCKVFLSTDAGGVGLNLQVASHLVNLDLPWNPAVLSQRLARVHRIGQRSSVNVIMMVSEGSFEERLEAMLDAKRALFAAVVGDAVEIDAIERSTLASRIETVMEGSFAASTGGAQREREAPASEEDEVSVLRARLGDALTRVVRLPTGRLIGVVQGDMAPAMEVPAVLLPANAAAALVSLGDASPLANATLLYSAEPKEPLDPALERRRGRAAAAERKLKAARALGEAGMRVEALGLFREAMSLGCRAALERGDPGEDTAAILSAVYMELVPGGALAVADAHALARVGELVRAFDSASVEVPEALLADVAREAFDLLARVRERLAVPARALAASIESHARAASQRA